MYLKVQDCEGLYFETGESHIDLEEKEIGIRDGIKSMISADSVFAAIIEFAKSVKSQFAKMSASKASIEFGLQFSVESGKVISIITKGTASCNIKVTLEWNQGEIE